MTLREAPPSHPVMARRDYAAELGEVHVKLTNLAHSLAKDTGVTQSQLVPAASGAQRLIDDAKALLGLIEPKLHRTNRRDTTVAAGKPTPVEDAAVPLRAPELSPDDAPTTPPERTNRGPGPERRKDLLAGSHPQREVATIASIGKRFDVDTRRIREMNPHLERYGSDDELPLSTPVRLRRGAPAALPDQHRPPTSERKAAAAVRTASAEDVPHKKPKVAHGKEEAAPSPAASAPGGFSSKARGGAPPKPISASPPGVDTIRSVATATGVSVQALIAANEDVLMPFGLDEALPPNVDLVIPEGRRVEERLWTRKGDTLAIVSRDAGVPMRILRAMNEQLGDVSDTESLTVGTEIALPIGPGHSFASSERPAPPHLRERRETTSLRGGSVGAGAVRRGEVDDYNDEDDDDSRDGVVRSRDASPRRFPTSDSERSDDAEDDGPRRPASLEQQGFVSIKLRTPTCLAQIADDHECPLEDIIALNEPGPRGGRLHIALLEDPTLRVPAGAVVRIPKYR